MREFPGELPDCQIPDAEIHTPTSKVRSLSDLHFFEESTDARDLRCVQLATRPLRVSSLAKSLPSPILATIPQTLASVGPRYQKSLNRPEASKRREL